MRAFSRCCCRFRSSSSFLFASSSSFIFLSASFLLHSSRSFCSTAFLPSAASRRCLNSWSSFVCQTSTATKVRVFLRVSRCNFLWCDRTRQFDPEPGTKRDKQSKRLPLFRFRFHLRWAGAGGVWCRRSKRGEDALSQPPRRMREPACLRRSQCFRGSPKARELRGARS